MLHRIRSESFSFFSLLFRFFFFLFVSLLPRRFLLLLVFVFFLRSFLLLFFPFDVSVVLGKIASAALRRKSPSKCRTVVDRRRTLRSDPSRTHTHTLYFFLSLTFSLFLARSLFFLFVFFCLYVLCLTSYGILHTSKNINRLAHKTEATFRPVAA